MAVGLHVYALDLSRQSANVVADLDWSCLQEYESFYVRWEEGATDFKTIHWAPMPTSWMGVRPDPAIKDQEGVYLCMDHMDFWVGAHSHTNFLLLLCFSTRLLHVTSAHETFLCP